MKHNLIIAIIIATSLFACKKKTVVVDDNNNNNNNGMPAATYDSSFVRFLANGVFVEIKTSPTAIYGSTIENATNNVSIYYSNNKTGSATRTFVIGYNQSGNYTTNVDYSYTRVSTNTVSNTAYWTSDNLVPTYGMLENNTAQTCTFKITKIKDLGNGFKAINGTFSSKLVDMSNNVMNITNGEFFDIRTN